MEVALCMAVTTAIIDQPLLLVFDVKVVVELV